MSEFPLVANRESPSLPEVGDDLDGHTRILRAVRECVMIGERRTKNLLSSFVRVSEIVDLGIAEVQGGRLVVATVGEAEIPDFETTNIGIASATTDITSGSLPVNDLAVVSGLVFEVQVYVTVPFDDGGAFLTVGTSSDHDALFTAADSILGVVGNSVSQIGGKFAADTQLNVYLTPGAASVGEAWVSVIYQGFDEITAVGGGGGGGGGGTVDSVQQGNNVSVDSSDPANPVVSVTLKTTRGASWSETLTGVGIVAGVASPYIVVPFAATISKVTLLANASTNAVVDIKKATYAGFPTLTSICAAAKPTLTAAQKSQDSTLTGWTTSVSAGDILQFVMDSVGAGVAFMAIQLELTY